MRVANSWLTGHSDGGRCAARHRDQSKISTFRRISCGRGGFLSVVLTWTGCARRLSARPRTAPNRRRRRRRRPCKWSRGCRTVPRRPGECAGVAVLWGRRKYVLLIGSVPSGEYSKMADLEAVLADVSYLMAMEKSKCTPAARASKKILLPDPR